MRADYGGGGGRLEIFVEVRGGNGANPEEIWEESWAGVSACYYWC